MVLIVILLITLHRFTTIYSIFSLSSLVLFAIIKTYFNAFYSTSGEEAWYIVNSFLLFLETTAKYACRPKEGFFNISYYKKFEDHDAHVSKGSSTFRYLLQYGNFGLIFRSICVRFKIQFSIGG